MISRLKSICFICCAILTVGLAFNAIAELPSGFITYSKGDGYSRTLHMVTLEPGMSEQQVRGSEKKICDKGSHGGDIQGNVSFDGKWIAFSRSVDAGDGYGPNDYHNFNGWSVHIARLHENGSSTPIKVADKGSYWPSWGDDSYGETKTLYYSTDSPEKCIRAVTVGPNGELSNDRKIGKNINISGYEGFAMAAPNGQWAAIRKGGWVHSINLFTLATNGLNDGCMPQVCADSRWVLNAKHKKAYVNTDGSNPQNTGDIGGDFVGEYHHGTSPDMQWLAAISKNYGADEHWKHQNEGLESALYSINSSMSATNVMQFSNDASWPDVHTWTGPRLGASFSATPSQISEGGSATLKWSTTNAASVSIDQNIGTVAASGQRAVSPTTETTYTLTATDADGNTITRTVTISFLAMREPENPSGATAGLNASYFEISGSNTMPDYSQMTPYKTGTVENINIENTAGEVGASGKSDMVGIQFTGYIDVPADAAYTFYTTSDDGSMLYIGSELVVSNDGQHGMDEKSGIIALKKGKHSFRVDYFEAASGAGCIVSWENPDASHAKAVVGASAFFYTDEASAPKATITLSAPKAGEKYAVCQKMTIKWWQSSDISNVTIEANFDGSRLSFVSITDGSSVQPDANGYGTYEWLIPADIQSDGNTISTVSKQVTIRVATYPGSGPAVTALSEMFEIQTGDCKGAATSVQSAISRRPFSIFRSTDGGLNVAVSMKGQYAIRIYDIKGTLVGTWAGNRTENAHIPLTLTSGRYIIHLTNNAETIIRPFCIQK